MLNLDLDEDTHEISNTESTQQINEMLLDNIDIDQADDKIKQDKKKYTPLPNNKKKLYIKPISDYKLKWIVDNLTIIFLDKVDNVTVYVSVPKKKYQFFDKKCKKPKSKVKKFNLKNKDEADLYEAAKEQYQEYNFRCYCSIY
ncbi:hypothetical protein M9Y10_027650 [Tritrichomonas musculus]|uniref:Uncharacterized protein n=1 Tax=Tritrichomonas musculus TaxID=1915356 RepID=A0ABR2H3L9_9EUKA